MEIAILNRQRGRQVSGPALRRFLVAVMAERGPGPASTVAVSLVSDVRMREYNRTFRGIDRETDVLSFPGEAEPDPDGELHLGDIVISVPTAARQARERGHGLARELKLLLLHGYLHLLGYDHETDDGDMMRLQRRLERRHLPATGARRAS